MRISDWSSDVCSSDLPAAEFEGFIRTWLDLPSIRDILADPSGAKVPTGPAALFAVATAIARNATATTFSKVLEYAKRLTRAYEILSGVAAQNRHTKYADNGTNVRPTERGTVGKE